MIHDKAISDHLDTLRKFYGLNDRVTVATQSVYKGLFGMYANEIAIEVGAPKGCDDETLRDHMGQLALAVLAKVESELSVVIPKEFAEIRNNSQLATVCYIYGANVRELYYRICREQNRRPLVD